LSGQPPELPLEEPLGSRGAANRRTARNFAGDLEREVGVAAQQVERLGASRFRDQLGPQVRRPDRIGLGDRRGPAILVPSHGERQAEREN
jgi:hypothetical protein